jgi:hypothetical protein
MSLLWGAIYDEPDDRFFGLRDLLTFCSLADGNGVHLYKPGSIKTAAEALTRRGLLAQYGPSQNRLWRIVPEWQGKPPVFGAADAPAAGTAPAPGPLGTREGHSDRSDHPGHPDSAPSGQPPSKSAELPVVDAEPRDGQTVPDQPWEAIPSFGVVADTTDEPRLQPLPDAFLWAPSLSIYPGGDCPATRWALGVASGDCHVLFADEEDDFADIGDPHDYETFLRSLAPSYGLASILADFDLSSDPLVLAITPRDWDGFARAHAVALMTAGIIVHRAEMPPWSDTAQQSYEAALTRIDWSEENDAARPPDDAGDDQAATEPPAPLPTLLTLQVIRDVLPDTAPTPPTSKYSDTNTVRTYAVRQAMWYAAQWWSIANDSERADLLAAMTETPDGWTDVPGEILDDRVALTCSFSGRHVDETALTTGFETKISQLAVVPGGRRTA